MMKQLAFATGLLLAGTAHAAPGHYVDVTSSVGLESANYKLLGEGTGIGLGPKVGFEEEGFVFTSSRPNMTDNQADTFAFVRTGTSSVDMAGNEDSSFLQVNARAPQGNSVMIKREDGSAFDLYSFDGARVATQTSDPVVVAMDITMEGEDGELTQLATRFFALDKITTIELNLIGVSAIVLSTSEAVGLDNFSVKYTKFIAANPLPAALPLFMAAAGIAGFVSRKRRTA